MHVYARVRLTKLLGAAGHHKAAVPTMSGRDLQQGINANMSMDVRLSWKTVISILYYDCWARPTLYSMPLQKEATEVFFGLTKLFQNKDANLRRMVYLVIKDVCPATDEVIIITSSLMKDMNSKTDLYRSNAIRVLCSIIDTQLLAQIER